MTHIFYVLANLLRRGASQFLLLLILMMGAAVHMPHAQAAQPASGTKIDVQAYAEFIPAGYTQTEVVYSNTVTIEVAAVEAISLTPATQTVDRAPLSPVLLSHVLSNAGNTTSQYTFKLENNGEGCPSTSEFTLGDLRLVLDQNANGAIDVGDTSLPLNTPQALTLAMGSAASLLVGGSTPALQPGSACVKLSVATQAASASSLDYIKLTSAAVLSINQTASYSSGILQPGVSKVSFTITVGNIGATDAVPVNVTSTGEPILVNGVQQSLVLVRDAIPTGLQYEVGSLSTQIPGAIKLFRLQGDPLYSYRTEAQEDASAIEVAIGFPAGVASGSAISLSFSTKIVDSASGTLTNVSTVHYNNGTTVTTASSNIVLLTLSTARPGLAKAAGQLIPQYDSNGTFNGTAVARFRLRAKNYGSTDLNNIQISDVLEGTDASNFGSYVSTATPSTNEYTIVANSLKLVSGSASAIGVSVNSAYTGQASASTMLSPGAVLPPGAEFTLQFDVLFNLTGRTATLYNSAKITATTSPNSTDTVTDVSANGSEPDANADGNPNNDSTPTPVQPQLPILQISKTASNPVRVTDGIYKVKYTLTVHNAGAVDAPNVRVVDNLDCTFSIGQANTHFTSWGISDVAALNGMLTISSKYTGKGPCDQSAQDSSNPLNLPGSIDFSLTDGSRPLTAGATEIITFDVMGSIDSAYLQTRNIAKNKAWVASYATNVIAETAPLQAASSSVTSLFMDPQGIVYDSISRTPLAGSKVKVRRTSCSASAATAITADQLVNGTDSNYSYDSSDGSLVITTDSTGEYKFLFQSPPAPDDLCEYSLSVTPPTGYTFPSTLLPAQQGTFSSCGNVVSNSSVPQGSDSTNYYLKVEAGLKNGAACEVMHNHIALDPENAAHGLILKKEGSKKTAEFGDFVEYQLTLTNNTGSTISDPKFSDSLPPGFAYVKGTTRINGASASDPAGGTGPSLTFSLPGVQLTTGNSLTVRYRLRIGVGAPTTGDAINRAQAFANGLQSNQASWRVKVSGGAFSDDAYAFGRVYLGCMASNDRTASPDTTSLDERKGFRGVPGVRLFLEDGTMVLTDRDGKWSLYGLKAITHVIKVDPLTLPIGSRLVPLSNRNAGAGDSRFLDVKKGEFLRADFLIDSCGSGAEALNNEVSERVKLYAQVNNETYKTRLSFDNASSSTGDVRGLAASGMINGSGLGASSTSTSSKPLIAVPTTSTSGPLPAANNAGLPLSSATIVPSVRSGQTDLLPPQPAKEIVDLEDVLPKEDNTPGFMGLHDGDTLPSKVTNVRVKGPNGVPLTLYVNDVAQEERRVGKKAVLESKNLAAWEYIGVELKPGKNELRLTLVDGFGNQRADERINVVAPDSAAKLVFELPGIARADNRKPIPIKLKLTDANGVPVTARTYVTIMQEQGTWLDRDLNPQDPGLQIAIEGGSTTLQYVPPTQPGDIRLQAIMGTIQETVILPLLPEQRPMVGIGIVEGVLDLSNRGAINLGKTGSANAFESELKGMSTSGSNSRGSGRTAFYVKGSIKGEYLLTAAFDSDKTTADRLFRDIRPDQYYPVYGDDSVRGYDAQSTQRLYVRIDKNRSYLLYGDFTTASSSEVRKLSQYSRSLTGVKNQYDNGNMRITSFASRTRSNQIVEELRALGISGPYYLTKISAGYLMEGSEKVEILVRDRSQPNVVLDTQIATRYVDYTIEALTGRLMFINPVNSFDDSMNPRSIRVTYEADLSGPEYTVMGTDAQFKLASNLQVGVVALKDDNPDNPRKIQALTALTRFGATTMAAEAVATKSDEKGDGSGARFELLHQTADLRATIQAFKTSASFDNPSGGVTAGRTEVNARADYKVSEDTRLRSEVIYSDDNTSTSSSTTNSEKISAAVALQKRITPNIVGEVAIRHGNSTGTSAGSFDYGQVTGSSGNSGTAMSSSGSSGSTLKDATTTVRARVTSRIPALPSAQVFAEVEQDVNSSANAAALGGSYAITKSTRLYSRYEFINSLASSYNLTGSTQRNVGLFGIENAYTQGGRLYNEYRLADTDTGRAATSAAGARQTFKLSEHWNGTAGIELTRGISGNSSSSSSTSTGDATAVVAGLSYINGAFKASSNAEVRNSSGTDTYAYSSGTSYRVNDSWTFLGRSLYTRTDGSDSLLVQARQQLGLAYRPIDDDSWNGLLRYEYKYENHGSNTTSATGETVVTDSNLSGSSTVGKTETHVLAGLINWQPDFKTQVTGRYAFKTSLYDADGIASRYWAQLFHTRLIRDLSPDWDMGVQAGVLLGQGGSVQTTLGIEAGYQVAKNTWVSAGYNFVGLKDPDLTSGEYTSKGPYMRLRLKFDENSLNLNGDANKDKNKDKPEVEVPQVLGAGDKQKPGSMKEARSNWTAGQPLPSHIEWREDLLFAPGSATLTKQGANQLTELVSAIRKMGIQQVQFTMGHGDPKLGGKSDAQLMLWLKRVKEIKTVLTNSLGPKKLDVFVDATPYDPTMDPLAAPTSAVVEEWPLHIAVLATEHIAPKPAQAMRVSQQP